MKYAAFLKKVTDALIENGFEHKPDWLVNRTEKPSLYFIQDGDSNKLIYGTVPADWEPSVISELNTPLERFHAVTFCAYDGKAWYCPFAIEVTVDVNGDLIDIRPTDQSIDGYRMDAKVFMETINKTKLELEGTNEF